MIFISCKEKNEKQIKKPEIETKKINDSVVTVSTVKLNDDFSESKKIIDTIKVREFAQNILKGKIYPSDDEITYDCIDQIFMTNNKDLDFYFKVFREIVKKSDGALAEGIGMHIMTFTETKTEYFIKQFQNFELDEKERIAGFLAFELYYS